MPGKQFVLTFWHRVAGLWFFTVFIFAGLLVMTGSIATPVHAAGSEATYVVLHQAPPLSSYQGGIAGLPATDPSVTGVSRLDSDSVASVAYLNYLAQQQAQLLTTMEMTLGRPLDVLFRYNAVLNGLAVRLAPSEAATVAALPGVARVVRDYDRHLLTDASPGWIGANGIWNGSSTGGPPGSRGEEVVVGVIDTGINHDHPSFADPGPVDGYNHTNPKGRFFGVCDPILGVPFCNDKLIGVYDFTGTSPQDDNGHGSHTASTAAGNVVHAALIAPTTTVNRTISGVAPHANIIAYKACVTTPAIGTCPISALLAAINQATLDEVDVINYSIGGGSSDPWSDLDAQAFFNARNAGIFVATSAGNGGPGAGTIGSPADAPWVLSVGASTHNRKFVNALVNMSGGATTPPADIEGKSVTDGYGPATIVYAGDYGNNLCGSGPAEAPLNPFPPGTFSGEIVVCDRGTYARVDKARFVAEAGAGGFVLANDQANGDSLVGDPYAIPGVHITYDDGVVLKAWIASGSGHVATITGTTADENASNGDVMASFSSRGPNPAVAGIIKPDVTAPGVDILAAFHTPIGSTATDPEYGVISGTSMSSPHAAGAAALIRAVHPDWTPDEVKSALMTSAFTTLPGNGSEAHDVLKEDAATPADPFDMGAGRIDLSQAARAGLVLDETPANYEAANPNAGGDPRTLNLASLADSDCAGVCTWTRVVASTQGTDVNWTAATVTPGGLTLSVAPSRFTLEPGGTQTITITADVTNATANQWHFAGVTLVSDSAALPSAHFPVAVLAKGGITAPRTTLYFHGNVHDGCTGDGRLDLVACDGPFLRPDPILDDNLAAHWGPVTPLVDGTADRNIYDPNWVWNLDGPTTVDGPMTVEWWASCGACSSGLLSADWFIRLWADGANVFEQRVTATPAMPNLPSRLEATVIVPEVTAGSTFVLHVDPVYIDSQENTFIYYDSTQACPGTSAGLCDSLVLMPIAGGPAPNQDPVAADDSATVARGETVDINVLANDSDPDGDTLTVASFTQPDHGNVSQNVDGTLRYTHDDSNTTADAFEYTVSDGRGGSDSAAVSITITSEPDEPIGGGKVTGGGWLATSGGDKLNFGFQVEQGSAGPEGDLQLRDKAAGVKINITEITAIGEVIEPCGGVSAGANAIEFRGSGTFNDDPATFRACVMDNTEPGNSAANPDLFYLACLSGCDYDSSTRTPDAGLDGGNIKVHVSPNQPANPSFEDSGQASGQAQPTNQPTNQLTLTTLLASDSASASVLILNPLLLAEAGIGLTQTLEVAAYDASGEATSGVTVTLEQTAAGSNPQTFTALTGVDGLALFTITVLSGEVEYIAYDNNLSSNAMNVEGILP